MINSDRGKKNEKGLVLVLVLIIVAILTVLVADFTFSTHVDIAISRNTLNEMKARHIAKSGVSLVSSLIKSNNLEQLDKVAATVPFLGLGQNEKGIWSFTVSSFPIGEEGSVSLKVEDERSKINLNSLVNPTTNRVDFQVLTALTHLFRFLEVDERKSNLFISSLVNWLDRKLPNSKNDQDSNGADGDFYGQLKNPYTIKDGQIDSVEEIRMIEGMDSEFYKKVKDYLTVYTDSKFVNFSTAPSPVMMAIIKAAQVSSIQTRAPQSEIKDSTVEAIVEEILEKRKEDNTISVKEVRNIVRNITSISSISAGLSGLVLKYGKSDIFLIKSTGIASTGDNTIRNIEAVIRKQNRNNTGRVIAWKER